MEKKKTNRVGIIIISIGILICVILAVVAISLFQDYVVNSRLTDAERKVGADSIRRCQEVVRASLINQGSGVFTSTNETFLGASRWHVSGTISALDSAQTNKKGDYDCIFNSGNKSVEKLSLNGAVFRTLKKP